MACSCANNIYRSTATAAVNTGGTALVITPDTALTPANENRVAIMVTSTIATAGLILPVQITLNGTAVPVYDKFGNILYGSEIRTNAVMKGYYGTNGSGGTAHLQLVNYPFCRCS